MYLDTLVGWAAQARAGLAGRGVVISLSQRTETDKRLQWIDLTTPVSAATVLVWASGECEVEIGTSPENAIKEHYELASDEALYGVLDSVVDRLANSQRD
jgi:hypothetical protein